MSYLILEAVRASAGGSALGGVTVSSWGYLPKFLGFLHVLLAWSCLLFSMCPLPLSAQLFYSL